MSEEMEVYQDPMEETIETAAEPEASAPSEPEGEQTPQETTTEPDKKDGVQSRIDELTRKRREAERELEYWKNEALRSQKAPEQSQPQEPVYPDLPEPRSEDFETYDAFVDARADYRAELKLRRYMDTQRNQGLEENKRSWNDQGRTKFTDWDEVFARDDVAVSETMGQTIMVSPKGHDLAYFLGKNPQESRRIAMLPVNQQAYELGKLEAKLAAPPQKTKTNAPVPTSPLGGKEVPAKSYENMSQEEYMATRERELGYRR